MTALRDATVVLVHSSGLGPGMWRAYAASVAPDFELVTPALLGYPPAPALPPETEAGTADVARVCELILSLPGRTHLVGHSYGGFVAASAALALPEKIASVALLEPVMFGALRLSADPEAAAELRWFDEHPWFLDERRGGTPEWLELFVDYWNGPGAWRALSPAQQAPFLAAGAKVFREVCSVSHDARPFADYRLAAPLLLMRGGGSTVAARRIVDHLHAANPEARLVEVAAAGHLFPVTHRRAVVPELLAHWREAELPGDTSAAR